MPVEAAITLVIFAVHSTQPMEESAEVRAFVSVVVAPEERSVPKYKESGREDRENVPTTLTAVKS